MFYLLIINPFYFFKLLICDTKDIIHRQERITLNNKIYKEVIRFQACSQFNLFCIPKDTIELILIIQECSAGTNWNARLIGIDQSYSWFCYLNRYILTLIIFFPISIFYDFSFPFFLSPNKLNPASPKIDIEPKIFVWTPVCTFFVFDDFVLSFV